MNNNELINYTNFRTQTTDRKYYSNNLGEIKITYVRYSSFFLTNKLSIYCE